MDSKTYNISSGLTPAQILQAFYKEHDLPADGGFAEPRVKIKMGNYFHLYIPNFDARRKALLKHDIHHLITGYSTEFKGETEISAWEIASGCRKYWAAWALDIQGLVIGFLFNLPNVFKAFVRGRHSMNLYSDIIADDTIVNMSLSEIDKVIKIPSKNEVVKATVGDFISFLWNLILGGFYSVAYLAVLPLLLIYNIVVFAKLTFTSAGSKAQ